MSEKVNPAVENDHTVEDSLDRCEVVIGKRTISLDRDVDYFVVLPSGIEDMVDLLAIKPNADGGGDITYRSKTSDASEQTLSDIDFARMHAAYLDRRDLIESEVDEEIVVSEDQPLASDFAYKKGQTINIRIDGDDGVGMEIDVCEISFSQGKKMVHTVLKGGDPDSTEPVSEAELIKIHNMHVSGSSSEDVADDADRMAEPTQDLTSVDAQTAENSSAPTAEILSVRGVHATVGESYIQRKNHDIVLTFLKIEDDQFVFSYLADGNESEVKLKAHAFKSLYTPDTPVAFDSPDTLNKHHFGVGQVLASRYRIIDRQKQDKTYINTIRDLQDKSEFTLVNGKLKGLLREEIFGKQKKAQRETAERVFLDSPRAVENWKFAKNQMIQLQHPGGGTVYYIASLTENEKAAYVFINNHKQSKPLSFAALRERMLKKFDEPHVTETNSESYSSDDRLQEETYEGQNNEENFSDDQENKEREVWEGFPSDTEPSAEAILHILSERYDVLLRTFAADVAFDVQWVIERSGVEIAVKDLAEMTLEQLRSRSDTLHKTYKRAITVLANGRAVQEIMVQVEESDQENMTVEDLFLCINALIMEKVEDAA